MKQVDEAEVERVYRIELWKPLCMFVSYANEHTRVTWTNTDHFLTFKNEILIYNTKNLHPYFEKKRKNKCRFCTELTSDVLCRIDIFCLDFCCFLWMSKLFTTLLVQTFAISIFLTSAKVDPCNRTQGSAYQTSYWSFIILISKWIIIIFFSRFFSV